MCDLNKPKLLKLINNTVINNRNILNKLLEKYPNADIQFKVLGDIRCQYNEPSLCKIVRYEVEKLVYINDEYMNIYEARRFLHGTLIFTVHGLTSSELEIMIEKELNKLEFKEYICLYIEKSKDKLIWI